MESTDLWREEGMDTEKDPSKRHGRSGRSCPGGTPAGGVRQEGARTIRVPIREGEDMSDLKVLLLQIMNQRKGGSSGKKK
jgi:hypothetical protein